MTSEQNRLLEELRKLSGIIEDIESQRIDLRLVGKNERPLLLRARRLRARRRTLIKSAAAAGVPERATAEAAHLTPGAVPKLIAPRLRTACLSGS